MNSAILVAVLKKELKKRGVSYKELARRLELSEANVKRFLSEQNFSLRRLDEICHAIGIDLGHLLRASEDGQRERHRAFPDVVEEALALDPELLLIWYCLAIGQSPQSLRKRLKLDKAGLHRVTRQLETLGLLEVLPNETYRLTYPKSTRWRPDGPLVKKYGGAILEEFFATSFQGAQEHQDFLTGALSTESFMVLKRKLKDFFHQFDQLTQSDAQLPEHDTEVFWLYSGIRPWSPVGVIEKGNRR